MAVMVRLAGNGFGGVVQGNWGVYQAASDGTWTVDSRDAPALIAQGMNYLDASFLTYATPLAPAAAAVAGVVSSGSLSNGTIAVTTQPTVMRPVTFEIGTGTGAITAGTASISYVANDGTTHTDVLSLVCPASSAVTQFLSAGVVTISSITIAGLTGGTSPWVRMSTTAAISLPINPNSVDLTVVREYDAGATVAVGTLSTVLGSITPTTAPNGTVTYSFAYSYVSAII